MNQVRGNEVTSRRRKRKRSTRYNKTDKTAVNVNKEHEVEIFLSGEVVGRQASAHHFLTLKIDFNFPFIFLVYGGRFSVHEVGGSSTVYSSPLMTLYLHAA